MKKVIFVFVVIAMVLGSCQPAWHVVDENAKSEVVNNALPYHLPENQLHIRLDIEQHHFIPGPYAAYASELLGLEGVEMSEKYFWNVAAVSIQESTLPDQAHRYFIVPEKGKPAVSYAAGGILHGINLKNTAGTKSENHSYFSEPIVNDPADLAYTDLQIDKNKYEVIDTTYRVIQRDSVVQRIPVYKSREEEKTALHKARDASDFIIRIRKNRFSLEAALEDQQVSGVDIRVMIEKLEALEKSYIQLFTGKTESRKFSRYYTLMPEAEAKAQSFVLDYLGDEIAEPVDKDEPGKKLEVMVLPLINQDDPDAVQSDKETKPALIYRQPMPVRHQVYLEDQLIYSENSYCPQMGRIIDLPASAVDENDAIKMNEKTGEIISIEKIE